MNHLDLSIGASSPGEWKSAGAGLTLVAGFTETPFGRALIGESPRGLCHLAFLDPWDESGAWADLQSRWPAAKVVRTDPVARTWAERIFDPIGGGASETVCLHLHGTDFQLSVWRALLAIPDGETANYGQIAKAIGRPKAHRATGTAVGRNPVAWVIPCHRVIRRDGELGNYRWGPDRKRAMLDREQARQASACGQSGRLLTPSLSSRATC